MELELEHRSPKDAVDKVFAERGGVIVAQSAGELPRGRTQAYNMKRTQLTAKEVGKNDGWHSPSAGASPDMLYVVMTQCKMLRKLTFLFKMLPVHQSPWLCFATINSCVTLHISAVTLSASASLESTPLLILETLVLLQLFAGISLCRILGLVVLHC